MTANKRFQANYQGDCLVSVTDKQKHRNINIVQIVDLLNEFNDKNEQLKQEVELLREGLNAYDNNLPAYLTCEEVKDFNSDLFEFKIKQQKFYNEHPNLCKIIIDGVELK